jgi:beta-glucosidase
VLKRDWGFEGFVMSDWGGTLSTVEAALAGLDRQSGENLDPEVYFGAPLLAAVRSGALPMTRLDDMVRRILVAMLSVGLFDPRPALTPDLETHAALARGAAGRGTVLLRNDGVLPLDPAPGRVLVVSDYDGVLSGGGSSQVIPAGSTVEADGLWTRVHHPSSLVRALSDRLPSSSVTRVPWSAGIDAAVEADVVVAVAEQWTTESSDVPDLSLPGEALLADLARAHPRVVLVLQTGGPVLMPWLGDVAAVVQGWYPGGQGGDALADVLLGRSEPGGRLPVTFPASLDQLPRPALRGAGATSHPGGPRTGHFAEDYDIEGADVGYRWYERQGLQPLFWFGAGLTYTTFSYADLVVETGDPVRLTVTVTNTGHRAGTAVPQFYAAAPDRTARLVGWQRVPLDPGEFALASVLVDPRLLSHWDGGWSMPSGCYVFTAGAHAGDRPLRITVSR